MKTSIVPVKVSALGSLSARKVQGDYLDELVIDLDTSSSDAANLGGLAEKLRTTDVPIAFPTETVYGLGADATRSEAVKGIYKAKQRPSDNPLIVHFASLSQIRRLLGTTQDGSDPIPSIYKPLIEQFWPGPLTILLPNSEQSSLALEVTAGLKTFGARIPRHPIALSLIQLADVPVAAPSANASTKPSPTAAEHVAYDLEGRIESIIDGGPCEVGVESTVVDGLVSPPLILRPGGISIEQIRTCSGWENVGIGYKDVAEKGEQPRAPGMKYRHYSPKAQVLLYAASSAPPDINRLAGLASGSSTIGIIRTQSWQLVDGCLSVQTALPDQQTAKSNGHSASTSGFQGMLDNAYAELHKRQMVRHQIMHDGRQFTLLDIRLGPDTADVARGIFAALRDLDREDVDAIIVEGVDEHGDHLAAAVMNRLKKAAETTV